MQNEDLLEMRIKRLEKLLPWIKREFYFCCYCKNWWPKNEMYDTGDSWTDYRNNPIEGNIEKILICTECLHKKAKECQKLQEAKPLKEE